MMTVSPLADLSRDIPALDRWSKRNKAISGFGIHHNAGVDAYGQATAPGREVSANYWITNSGAILPNVDEEYRAFTSGAAGYPAGAEADHRNITVEVSNTPEGVRNGTWAISDAALEALARLIADVYSRYGLGPVLRGAGRGIGIHSDWVATECPGPYMRSRLPSVIARAEAIRTGNTSGGGSPVPKPKEWYEMLQSFSLKSERKTNQVILGKDAQEYVTFRDVWSDKKSDRTLMLGPGHIVGSNVNVGAKGETGTRAVFELVAETESGKNRRKLAGPVRQVVDGFGKIGFQIGFTGHLKAGELVRLLVQVQDGKKLEITSLFWNGETA